MPFKFRPGLARCFFFAKIGGYFHSRVLEIGKMVHGYALKSPRGQTRLDYGITHLSIYPISESVNHKDICRTATATQGLLKKDDMFLELF